MTARCSVIRERCFQRIRPSMEGRSRDRPMRRQPRRSPRRHPPSMEGRSRDRPMDSVVDEDEHYFEPSMEGRSRDRPMSSPHSNMISPLDPFNGGAVT